MRAVTVTVIGVVVGRGRDVVGRVAGVSVEVIADEVPTGHYAAARTETTTQIGVVVVHAGVHHCYADAFAGVA